MKCQHFCTEEKLDSDVWEPDTGEQVFCGRQRGYGRLEETQVRVLRCDIHFSIRMVSGGTAKIFQRGRKKNCNFL